MLDFLLLDQELTAEEKLIRDSVRAFVDETVLPVIGDSYLSGAFPSEFIQGMGQMGLLGMTLPQVYGGSDASYVAYGLVCQELERGDSGLRSFASVQSSLVMYPIFKFGSDEQKAQYLKKLASAQSIGCFGLTEPDSGSDPGSMKTKAEKVEGGYLLNGAKMWITNAPIADLAVVWAKYENEIAGFIVEKGFKGFSTKSTERKLSLRASHTGELIFQDVFIPEVNRLPFAKGLAAPLACLNQARYGIAWGVMGAAQHCYEVVLDYTSSRKQFKKPLASFQLVQKDLVDMFNEIVKAQLMNLRIGRLRDKGQDHFAMVSLAKMNSCKEALNIARMARNLLGANGISTEYPVFRHMNNLESVFTYEGTDNVHHLIVGRYLTGFNAFE